MERVRKVEVGQASRRLFEVSSEIGTRKCIYSTKLWTMKTLMVVQVSPTLSNANETTCSLAFVERVRKVEVWQASRRLFEVSSEIGTRKCIYSTEGPWAWMRLGKWTMSKDFELVQFFPEYQNYLLISFQSAWLCKEFCIVGNFAYRNYLLKTELMHKRTVRAHHFTCLAVKNENTIVLRV